MELTNLMLLKLLPADSFKKEKNKGDSENDHLVNLRSELSIQQLTIVFVYPTCLGITKAC